ncbi:MAG: hypothetical protein AB7N70_18535 [Dehalococcoidia bacterium]
MSVATGNGIGSCMRFIETRTIIRSLDEIPTFADEDEERAFWATHEVSDELAEAAEPIKDDELPPARQGLTTSEMRMTYQLWSLETGNAIGEFDSEAKALAFVREAADEHGQAVASNWGLTETSPMVRHL